MIPVFIYAATTAENIELAMRVQKAAGRKAIVELAPACAEPLKSDLGPLPSCCLPVGHDGDHDPYGRTA